MKKTIISLILLVLLAGCLGQTGTARPSKEEVGKELGNVTAAPVKELISVSGSDNLSVVSISAVNQNGSWCFPMKDYEGQFQSAGLYSTAFIRLNDSQIRWLGNDESIWLTAMVRNGTGVLFNAIYSNDAINCSAGNVRILGRNYPLSGLRNGSSFLMDDKWKVAVDSQGNCPSRIVIYMDGYFDKMKDGEQINLFRNDNTILLFFEGLVTSPSLRVIATRPAEAGTTSVQTLIRTYSPYVSPGQQQIVDTIQGERIITETTTFHAPLQAFTDRSAGGQEIETNGSFVPKCQVTVLDEDYVLPNFNNSGIVLAKESAAGVIKLGENLSVDALRFRLDDIGFPSDGLSAIISVSDANGNILAKDNLSMGETKTYTLAGKNYHFHVYNIAPGYTIGASWAYVAVFSQVTYLKDGGIFTTPSNDSYLFDMNWTSDKQLQGWQFRALR